MQVKLITYLRSRFGSFIYKDLDLNHSKKIMEINKKLINIINDQIYDMGHLIY